jgi:hypothetical protein
VNFLYTARGRFDKSNNQDGFTWDKYIEWSKLAHLTELVSLDGMLNEILVEPLFETEDDWNFIYTAESLATEFFTSIDYVFKRLKKIEKFNLLTVVIEPEEDCENIKIDGFEFVGYDLLDHDYCISALSNCGGFDESFLPNDLNEKGLIDGLEKAYSIKTKLFENNPDEHHADTNVIAVWRHKTIGW